MKNIWLVANKEFSTRVRQRSFILMTLALPIIVLVGSLASNISIADEAPLADQISEELSEVRLGIVDQAGVINGFPEEIPADAFTVFSSAVQADEAVRSGSIEAYYFIPPAYIETGEVRRVSMTIPNSPPDNGALEWTLVWNLSQRTGFDRPQLLRDPLGPQGLRFVNLTSESERAGASPVPMFAAIIILVPLFTNGGLLFQSLTKEKEGRIMEVLLASLRPRDLLIGKVVGISGLMLLQYFIWGIMAAAGLLIAGQQLEPIVANLSFSQVELGLVLAYAVAGFFLYAGLMAGIGALAPDSESSRAWLFVVTLPMTIPIYLGATISSDPQGMAALVLSIFPASAPVAMLIRMAAATVPDWQLGASLVLLVVSVVLVLLLMARLFRAQTLLSGESLSLSRFWQAVRSG